MTKANPLHITKEDVEKCKACEHPKAQRTAVRGFLSDLNQWLTLEVCAECEGVLENDVLVHPLYPQDVQLGRNKANIEAARRRHMGA